MDVSLSVDGDAFVFREQFGPRTLIAGTVSILINCAGIALPQKLFGDTTDAEYEQIFRTNVLGTMRLTRTSSGTACPICAHSI